MEEIFLIDKPKDWTSFDVVARIRGEIRKKLSENKQPAISNQRIKVGHAGTLDPFATGLLIVLVGKATKRQAEFMKLDKEYKATLKLGEVSTTGDPEGTITPYVTLTEAGESTNDKYRIPTEKEIEKVLKGFIGEQKQIPPKHSAIKVKGKKAYELARAGQEFELKPRTIILRSMIVKNYRFPFLELLINCSSGTYVRSLAKDIGDALGTGAYLTELKRTKIGDYKIEEAKNIEEVIKEISGE